MINYTNYTALINHGYEKMGNNNILFTNKNPNKKLRM